MARARMAVDEESGDSIPSVADMTYAPQSVQDFMDKIGTGVDFTIIVSRMSGAVPSGVIKEFSADERELAEINSIGNSFGPGRYKWTIKWVDANGQRQQESFVRELAPDIYGPVHNANTRAAQPPALVPQITMPEGPDIAQVYRDAISFASQQGKGGGASDMMPMIAMISESNKTTMTMMGMMMQGMMGVVSAVMARPSPQEHKTENSDPFAQMERMVSMFGKMGELQKSLGPQEKETIAEKLVSTMTENLPMVLALVEQKLKTGKEPPMMPMIRANADVKQADSDPEIQRSVCVKLARAEGLQTSLNFAKAMGWSAVVPELEGAIAKKIAKSQAVPPAPASAPVAALDDDGDDEEDGDAE